jgi:thiosulfate reductase cytochrome b subunit
VRTGWSRLHRFMPCNHLPSPRTLLGGYEMARWEHFLLTMGFCRFFLIHVTQVVLAGWNNFRGMVSGLEVKPI